MRRTFGRIKDEFKQTRSQRALDRAIYCASPQLREDFLAALDRRS